MNIFVTGTDTGCGKTYVSSAIVRRLAERGLRAVGMKPVATGCENIGGEWHNEDVDALMAAANVKLARETINPYRYLPPASPHIAAAAAGDSIELGPITDAFRACHTSADAVVVEGVGGWAVPLAPDLDVADLARALKLPVLIVVGVKLGAISHARLTAAAIGDSGLPCLGWVANLLDDTLYAREAVLETLESALPWPCLGRVEKHDEPALSALIDILVSDLST